MRKPCPGRCAGPSYDSLVPRLVLCGFVHASENGDGAGQPGPAPPLSAALPPTLKHIPCSGNATRREHTYCIGSGRTAAALASPLLAGWHLCRPIRINGCNRQGSLGARRWRAWRASPRRAWRTSAWCTAASTCWRCRRSWAAAAACRSSTRTPTRRPPLSMTRCACALSRAPHNAPCSLA